MNEIENKLLSLAPRDEITALIREAAASVEADLALEDAGWVNLSGTAHDVITQQERITNLKLSRLYAAKDPMGAQAIRLWTDYTFGSGMTWDSTEDSAKKVLEAFWDAPVNKQVLSGIGQRKCCTKLLVDGEVFFVIFPGSVTTIRTIDPLEITEIITDPDDMLDVKLYRRDWSDAQGKPHTDYYRSTANIKNEPGVDFSGASRTSTSDALIYHLVFNSMAQRGNPLLLPALTWLKYYTKFLSSRIAVMLALAKFAWRSKVKGGSASVNAIKAVTHDKEVDAGSHLVENLGVDTQPIRTETGAQGAYQDGRQIKLMVSAAVGIPEQYFGDISIGNLATAKTVELPMQKMFQSYQAIWMQAYQDINEFVLAHNKVDQSKWYVDMNFPPIAPEDILQAAQAIVSIVSVFPQFANSPDVQQMALLTMGINDPAEVLDALGKVEEANPSIALSRVLKTFRESLTKDGIAKTI